MHINAVLMNQPCDLCKKHRRSRMICAVGGQWANMCEECLGRLENAELIEDEYGFEWTMHVDGRVFCRTAEEEEACPSSGDLVARTTREVQDEQT